MDPQINPKPPKNHSLTKRLLLSLLVPVLLLLSIAAAISVWTTTRSVNRLYDEQMVHNADILSAYLHYEVNEYISEEDDDDDHDDNESDEDEKPDSEDFSDYLLDDVSEELLDLVADIELQQSLTVNYRLSVAGKIVFTSSAIAHFPLCGVGLNTVEIGADNDTEEYWRCYRRKHTVQNNQQIISTEIFEPTENRRRAINSLILSSFTPLLVLPLLIIGITLWAVRRGLSEVKDISNIVAQRSINHLQHISPDNKPRELLPVINSVNNLLDRVEDGITREKQFTDDAAHELRTPITSIKMLEQLLRRGGSKESQLEHLDSLRDAADRCSYLIDQLLRLARYQSQQQLQRVKFDVHTMLNDQLGLLSPLITEKNLSIEWLEKDTSIIVEGDVAAMSLLVNNILGNAIKFSDDHGSIYLSLNHEGLRIEDDGPGIDEEEWHRVFDRFFRSASAKDKIGSGLGLSLAKWVADAHSYDLRVVKTLKGRGSAFILSF